ncbi:AI-2E family transporter [Flavobacterium oreochromis]|uniref:AI-2E family transporter n=2 Tax=Flavobacterium TaxID=237 RepID=A0A246GAZ0_9FLAO|nr:AI-2E family transporter [Flavobacterium oreochromis]OWP76725.1 AI-2E family transporter [Flavobacterium oreochromis]OWP77433.1 AI-2E family transporter [Flavobacterium oreochromis]POR22996.1 AI-2E family transporter [Flavobacterium columnare]
MESKAIANGIIRAVITLVTITLLVYFLYKIKTVIIYLVISLLLSMIGSPIVDFFRKKLRFKNTLAVLTTLSLFGVIIASFFLMFIPLINSQATHISLLDSKTLSTQIEHLIIQLESFLNTNGFKADQILNKNNLTKYLNFHFLSEFLNTFINTISNFGMGIASSFFITFFFLKDRAIFLRLFKNILPDEHEEKIIASFKKIDFLLLKYFSGILLQLLIVFILYLIVLFFFNVENSLIIAFICAVLNIIPYIGPLIASVLAVTLSLLGSFNGSINAEMLYHSLYILIGFFIVQFIDNNFSQPIIFSNSTNSHPLEIFLVILIFGFLFGIMGMIIAVPSYTILKVIGKEFFPDNKFIHSLTKNL